MNEQKKQREDAALVAAKEMLLEMLTPLDAAEKKALLRFLLQATE